MVLDILVYILSTTLDYPTPILIAAMGELIGQRSGVLNLGIEGTMLIGAFMSYFASIYLDNLYLGILLGILTGIGFGLIIGTSNIVLGRSQIVTGISMNMMGIDLSSFLFVKTIADVFGKVPPAGTITSVIFGISPFTFLAVTIVPTIWLFLYRTTAGLKIRAVGENPDAADVAGISVFKTRFSCLLFATALAGLAGSSLAIGTTGLFTHNMTAARGFIAISVVILSNWSPKKCFFGALIFGLVYSIQAVFQAYGVPVPWQITLTFPYVVAIIALLVASRRAQAPAALMIPFLRKR
ncbi:MAG: ABC transporter permease [Candidatus Hadarchaeaceae archaeon]